MIIKFEKDFDQTKRFTLTGFWKPSLEQNGRVLIDVIESGEFKIYSLPINHKLVQIKNSIEIKSDAAIEVVWFANGAGNTILRRKISEKERLFYTDDAMSKVADAHDKWKTESIATKFSNLKEAQDSVFGPVPSQYSKQESQNLYEDLVAHFEPKKKKPIRRIKGPIEITINGKKIDNVKSISYDFDSLNAHYESVPDLSTQLEARCMAIESKSTFSDMIKSDAENAAYKVVADQLTAGSKRILLNIIGNNSKNKQQLKSFELLLDSEIGSAIMSSVIGLALMYVPEISNDKRVEKLAENFRVNGMATAGNLLANETIKSLIPMIKTAINVLPTENKIRVEKLAEETIGDLEEDVKEYYIKI